jgi:hypothetical protein
VAADIAGLRVVDVSDPSNPVEVGFYPTPNVANGVAASGDYAYVAANTAGLRVVDVSDPSNPVEVGFCDTPGQSCGVAVSAGHAYVADWGAGLRVVDVSIPSNPVEIGFLDTPSNACGVALSCGFAYVAAHDAGLRVLDISDPSNPIEVGYYDTPGYAYGVAVSGNHAYLADWYHFEVFDCSAAPVYDRSDAQSPTTFALMAPFPNPFNLATSVMFDLPQAFDVRVSIHDIRGRAVRTEALGMLSAGNHRYIFNGSGLSSGTYFFRLEAKPHSAVRKISLVK